MSGFGFALYAASRIALSFALFITKKQAHGQPLVRHAAWRYPLVCLFSFLLPTYTVLFLLPLGCLSDELLWKDESGPAFSGVSPIRTAEPVLLWGELADSWELFGAAAGDGGRLDMASWVGGRGRAAAVVRTVGWLVFGVG